MYSFGWLLLILLVIPILILIVLAFLFQQLLLAYLARFSPHLCFDLALSFVGCSRSRSCPPPADCLFLARFPFRYRVVGNRHVMPNWATSFYVLFLQESPPLKVLLPSGGLCGNVSTGSLISWRSVKFRTRSSIKIDTDNSSLSPKVCVCVCASERYVYAI